jgi:SAM-dependent methyltransferase
VADPTTLEAYAEHARDFLARDATLVTSPLAGWFPVAFPPGSRVIDVGAGGGREVQALLREGYDAWGIEPVEALRRAANERLQEPRVIEGALPGLLPGETYDGLVCAAVLQHLPRTQLFDAVVELRGLLKPGGRALVSVPRGERGDVREGRDPWRRLFSDVRPEEYQLLFERVGFSTLARREAPDSLGRSGAARGAARHRHRLEREEGRHLQAGAAPRAQRRRDDPAARRSLARGRLGVGARRRHRRAMGQLLARIGHRRRDHRVGTSR